MSEGGASIHCTGELLSRRRHAMDSGIVVDIGDVAIHLQAHDAVRWSAMMDLLERLPPSEETPAASIVFGSFDMAWPRRAPDVDGPDVMLWFRHHDERHDLVIADGSGLTVAITGEDVRIGGESRWLAVGFRRVFPLALGQLLVRRERILLHAGGLVCADGAWITMGPTGAGKSTLALAAHKAGWPCMADDLVVARFDAGEVKGHRGLAVHGVARPVSAPADVVSGSERVTALEEDSRGRSLVHDVSLMPGWFPLVGTLLVGHSSQPDGELQPAGPAEIMAAAIASFHGASEPDVLRTGFPYLAAMARLPSWRLLHGTDESHRLQTTTQHLRKACHLLRNFRPAH